MDSQEWSDLRIDKGRVKAGTPLIYEFEYKGEKKITQVSAECGCTGVAETNNKVRATLNTSISHHLEEQLYNKKVTVYFADGTTQELRLLATVTKQ